MVLSWFGGFVVELEQLGQLLVGELVELGGGKRVPELPVGADGAPQAQLLRQRHRVLLKSVNIIRELRWLGLEGPGSEDGPALNKATFKKY